MSQQRTKGFTLIELMVVLAVMAITIGFVAPNFGRIVSQNRVSSVGNDILNLMHAGRMEALRGRRNVVVCPSQNGTSCGGSSWSSAIMFVDMDRNNQVSTGEQVRRMIQIPSDAVQVTNLMSGTAGIVFLPNGMARFASGAITNANVASVCSIANPDQRRTIQVGVSMAQTKIVKPQTDREQATCG